MIVPILLNPDAISLTQHEIFDRKCANEKLLDTQKREIGLGAHNTSYGKQRILYNTEYSSIKMRKTLLSQLFVFSVKNFTIKGVIICLGPPCISAKSHVFLDCQ